MAQAVTKVLDKMERGVTSMRGIGQYNECFVDFLIILMSISTLSARWITANLAGPTIRFVRKQRNENNEVSNLYGINFCVFEELIAIWRTAYNYYGPTVCAKDQTKVAEMVEVCRTRQQWVGSIPIDTSIIPHVMTAEELHAKISSLEKATYITVYALSAILLGIPPLVLAVIPSNQKETKAKVFFENNKILKELVKSGAKPIGLYFDGATHNRSWIGETYSKNSSVYSDLNIISDDTTFFSKKFPIGISIFYNGQPLISGTDVFHCVKKGRNMHNGGARVCPIGNFIMSTEHLWYLKEKYGNKSGLTNEVLNPKDKQADELAERFFSSNVLKAMVQHAIDHNDDSSYGDILYHFFAGLLFESWKSRTMDHLSRVQLATIFFAMTRYYLLSNPNQRNSQKYGISWQLNDDFIYLGTTLILLIHQFPNNYPGTPLCPWIISTAFLEHIFGYARRIIEDFTVLDFLMMSEKLIKTISVEMKGNLIRPDNNDGYNIHLSTASDKLPETLSNFPNIYDIDSNMIKVSKAMNSILQSVGINYKVSEYITIIQNTLCTLKHDSFSSVLGTIADDADDIDDSDIDDNNSDQTSEDQISKMLLQHQHRIKKRNNLPTHFEQLISENDDEFRSEHNTTDTTDNSFFDIVNHDVQCKKGVDRIFIMKKMGETRAIFDEYTQKEHKKSNNKTANNTKNFVVLTDNGPIELAAALRYERMHANAKSVRTKGRISRWTTACKKVFETVKMNPQVFKFKAGCYFFFVDKSHSILIAEIIAVFVKRGASYIRTDVSDGENANRIHARLFDQSPDSNRKFIPITATNRAQFTCEVYSFRFFAALGDIETTFYDNIANIENSIISAEKIMNTKKQDKNDDDSY
ncbi:unnamed protein product [Rhizophagus irregularis]|nr:unnamed protein product [Rhizophagus irregularis]